MILQDLIFWINGNTDISSTKTSVSPVHATVLKVLFGTVNDMANDTLVCFFIGATSNDLFVLYIVKVQEN